MPRSRTHARRRAARLAENPSLHDPGKTAGLMGHFYREVWRRFARLEDYDMWCDGQAVHPDRRTRRLAILARIHEWFAAVIAEETKAGGGA